MPYKVALTAGVFDCFHKGHMNLLKLMAEKADVLWVIMHDDWSTFENKGRITIQPLADRMHNVKTAINKLGKDCEIVPTYSASPEKEITKAIASEYSIIYMRGDDWTDFPAKDVLINNHIPIEYVSYTKEISTTQIRQTL